MNKCDRYRKRWGSLVKERSTWIDHWKELADFILPRRQRFQQTERNKGTKRNSKIINNTPTRALRTLASGLMAGITSPARPWFRLATPNPELMELHTVRQWLHEVERRMRDVFSKSNIYNSLAVLYKDLPCFGVSPLFVEEDPDDVIRGYVQPVGSYCVSSDFRFKVATIYREMSFTVEQLEEKFGLEAMSRNAQRMFKKGEYDTAIPVIHVIEPNNERKPDYADFRGMRWRSLWFEVAGDKDKEFLGIGGFNEFPVMVPRWGVTGEDDYGECPGMDCLGDIKAIQHLERRKAQIIDKLTIPPMAAPTSLRGKPASQLPGHITYYDPGQSAQKFEPIVEVDARALFIKDEIAEHAQRVSSTFFADLFLALLGGHTPQMTAREVEERHDEKMLQLGPVLERLQDELLKPLIDRTFAIMSRKGLIPAAPPELQGVDLKVEYLSVLAQAQKLLNTVGIERLLGFVQAAAATHDEAIDNVDIDAMVQTYGELLGVEPDLLRGKDEVSQRRQQRAEQVQADQAAAMASTARDGAAAAKDLSGANISDDNALKRMLSTIGAAA